MTSARDWRGLLFVAPFLLLYAIILIYPLLRGFWLSLNQVDLFGAGHFVGLGNYLRLIDDPIFTTSMVNTFKVTLMIVPVLTVLALAIAIALNRASGGAAIRRVRRWLLQIVTSAVVAGGRGESGVDESITSARWAARPRARSA